MATITHDGLWFCHDCTFAYAGVDETIVDQGRAAAVEAGQIRLNALGHVVNVHNSETGEGYDEFSRRRCACCGTTLGGSRHEHAILG